MKRFIRTSGLAAASLAVSAPLFAQAAPLYITEFTVTPTAGEMAEIYNPGTETVDLTDVYITDATFAGGAQYWVGGRYLPGARVLVTPNLTPHPDGIGGLGRAGFIELFRQRGSGLPATLALP